MKFDIQEELKHLFRQEHQAPIDPERFVADGAKGEAWVELLNQVDERLAKQSRLQYKSYQEMMQIMERVLEAAVGRSRSTV